MCSTGTASETRIVCTCVPPPPPLRGEQEPATPCVHLQAPTSAPAPVGPYFAHNLGMLSSRGTHSVVGPSRCEAPGLAEGFCPVEYRRLELRHRIIPFSIWSAWGGARSKSPLGPSHTTRQQDRVSNLADLGRRPNTLVGCVWTDGSAVWRRPFGLQSLGTQYTECWPTWLLAPCCSNFTPLLHLPLLAG